MKEKTDKSGEFDNIDQRVSNLTNRNIIKKSCILEIDISLETSTLIRFQIKIF